MTEETIPCTNFTTVAVIDSNVALECLALEQLAWAELDPVGPIVILVTPTVLKEVDGMKHHTRIGEHARRFNRLVSPAAVAGISVVVREASPRVELRLGTVKKISWEDFPDLDKAESDARIIAEALHCQGFDKTRMVVISHDIRPLGLARNLGVRVHHVSDKWLRPKEISPAEKKVAQQAKRITELEGSEPTIELSIECEAVQPVEVYWVDDLNECERRDIEYKILDMHPMKQVDSNDLIIGFSGKYEYEREYGQYERKTVPDFVSNYERKIELAFGQIPITIRFSNCGNVRADSLVLKIAVEGGWINDKFVFACPAGPTPPYPQSVLPNLMAFQQHRPAPQVGRHQVELIESPDRSSMATLNCEDFRHGITDYFRCIAWCNPRTGDHLTITASATAANLHGEKKAVLKVNKLVRKARVEDLLNLEDLHFKKPPAIAKVLAVAAKTKDFGDIEWDK